MAQWWYIQKCKKGHVEDPKLHLLTHSWDISFDMCLSNTILEHLIK